jgi:hypothetical protein
MAPVCAYKHEKSKVKTQHTGKKQQKTRTKTRTRKN